MNLDMRAAMLGQAVRAYLAGRGAGSKTPVAFLYNGVRLPKLPEWDKTAYPYAVIMPTATGLGTGKWLYVFEQTPYVTPLSGSGLYFNIQVDSRYAYLGLSYEGSQEGWTGSKKEYIATEDENTVFGRGATWTNFDLLNEDGTVYLFASDPIPVYE